VIQTDKAASMAGKKNHQNVIQHLLLLPPINKLYSTHPHYQTIDLTDMLVKHTKNYEAVSPLANLFNYISNVFVSRKVSSCSS